MTSPAGSVSIAQELLRTSLAACVKYQTWAGAADATAALATIYHEALPPPAGHAEYTLAELLALRPYALIGTQRFAWRQIAGGAAFAFAQNGGMRLRLVQDVDPTIATDEAEIGRRFMNAVGEIIDELTGLAGTGGKLAISAVMLAQPYIRSHPDDARDEGDVVMVEVGIEWGET